MSAKTLISIVIPVKNGIDTIKECLDGIFSQTLIDQTEVIIIDSGSTDGTLDIIRLYPVRLYQIAPQDFNHGATRNYGVTLAKGEIIVMTVQDAIAANELWIENIYSHFNDPDTQGVVGMQGVNKDKKTNPAMWFHRFSDPVVEIRQLAADAFDALSSRDKFKLSNWDNVNAAYRKKALLFIPFEETNYSEDWLWAKSALSKGLKIKRDPNLLVFHYHHHSFRYNFRVKFITQFYHHKYFSYIPPFELPIIQLVSQIKRVILIKELSVKQKSYWILHNIGIFFSGIFAGLTMKLSLLFSKGKSPIKMYNLLFKKNIPQGKANED
jgi:rhamnosyltransferase